MKTYKIFKYSNSLEEYHEAFRKGFQVNTILNSFGLYLIEFDESFDKDEAEFICQFESKNCKTRCFVSLDGDKIYLSDWK